MSSVDSNAAIIVEESFDDILTEIIAGTSLREFESLHVRVGIGPHQVREGTFMRNLLDPLYLVNVVYVQ